jgi:hypothetical protein
MASFLHSLLFRVAVFLINKIALSVKAGILF